MWICIKTIEREMELVGSADTLNEICDVMYEDMCNDLGSEADLIDAINLEEAEFNTSDCFGWSNYLNVNRDWKCFWV